MFVVDDRLGYFLLGPGPPSVNDSHSIPNCYFRQIWKMSTFRRISDSESSSPNDDLVDIVLNSDMEGISDRELQAEIDKLSGSDDDANVTVKELKP